MSDIELALEQFASAELTSVRKLATLVDALRPKAGALSELDNRWDRLCLLLQGHERYRLGVGGALTDLLEYTTQVALYSDSGILPNSGFFSELSRRVSRRLLPDVRAESCLKDALSIIFHHDRDFEWLGALTSAQWGALRAALMMPDAMLSHTRGQLLLGVRVLSHRIAAISLDPELVGDEAVLGESTPFLEQSRCAQRYLDDVSLGEEALLRLLGDCHAQVRRIQQSALQRGTSITMTFKLRRLRQILRRMERLLGILSLWRSSDDRTELLRSVVELLGELVRAENRKNHIGEHMRQSLDLLSVRVTENASKHGEHYITETHSEYFEMLRSALGGGAIMAVVAMDKLFITLQHFAPMTEALLFSINYAFGFMLVHILGFTVATKQPAMTAAAIAASIDEAGSGMRDLNRLVDLIARTVRSQLVAIVGNIAMAFPVAVLLGTLIWLVTGHPFLSPEKSASLLQANFFDVSTFFYAAFAGVCLFIAGLIAGYYDNLAAYNRIPQRLRQLAWLRFWLGEARLLRVSNYLERNLGALAGNFYLGFLLGGVGALGVLFGLPVDIRHVTLSTGMFGYSLTSLDFKASVELVLYPMLGIALIGVTNLTVSFTLALMVAFEARNVTFAQGRLLIGLLLRRMLFSPREFLLPPRRS